MVSIDLKVFKLLISKTLFKKQMRQISIGKVETLTNVLICVLLQPARYHTLGKTVQIYECCG